MALKTFACVVCKKPTDVGLLTWHYTCSECGYEGASLAPAINEAQVHESLDEKDREVALKSLRQTSFRTILNHASRYVPGGRLLDVGSAHGWFLEEARGRFDVFGLEPDHAVYLKAAAKGLKVRNGYFPNALETDERFDIIVFNDVIEHIPDIGSALGEIHRYLTKDGILVLNLPNSQGLFYRVSKLLARAGVAGPFKRMWQYGLPSPHVHYFNSVNLGKLVQSRKFSQIEQFELPSVHADGLLERIRCVGGQGALKSYMQYLVIRAMIPFLRLFQSDIIVAIFRKHT